MKKILKKLKKMNLSNKGENILVGIFFFVAIIVCLFINDFYKTSKLNEKELNLKNAFYSSNNQIFKVIENNERDLNAICYEISKEGSPDSFDEYVKLYSDDFIYLDYIGILKNSVLVKDYYPNGSFNVEKEELELSYIKLGVLKNEYGADITFFVDRNNNLCSMAKQPIYFYQDGTKTYYGEILFRYNVTKVMEQYFKPDVYDLDITKELWKFSIAIKNGSVLEAYSHKAANIRKPYDVKFDNSNLTYIYTISDSLIKDLDNTNTFRMLLMLFVVCLLAFGVKTLFVIYRKQVDIDRINDTKLDFFTNIVYEVRTSTNSIIGFCNEVEKEPLTNNAKGYVHSSKDELKKLLHKINNLLDITNLVESKLNTYEEEYYIHMLIQEVMEEYKADAEDKDIKLILEMDENLPIKFKGAKTILKKTLYHLLDNAFATIIDGHIKVQVSSDYTTQAQKTNVKIIVSDTGIGIKSEDIKDILLIEKLKDTSASDDNRVELAIASELLKTANGTLKVTSEYGKGTICTLTIPEKVVDDRVMTEEMLNGLKEKYRRNLGKLKKVHANILVIDDNEVNLSVIKNIIKIYGADVDCAKSGVIASELATVKNYDMVFIDYLMPELDGVETLKKLRGINKKYRTVPCILVSANTFSKEEEFRNAGFDEYLAKPIVQKDIERILKTLLSVELLECESEEF